MFSLDDFQYAIENTQVVLSPQRRLETFGTTLLNYYLITEEMDSVDESTVREGRILAERPEILTPSHLSRLLLEGFGEQAESFAKALGQQGKSLAILKYGFHVKKSDVRTYQVHEPLQAVADQVKEQVRDKNDPLAVVLTGVDDGWEVCLLKFMMDMVTASGSGNVDDLHQRGLL
ncbi:MAG: hypothetical protein V1746_06460 [bacterium]